MVGKQIASCLLGFCAVAAASAQSAAPAAPPMKVGLWETSVTSQMTGFQLPPEIVAKLQAMGRSVPGGPHTVVMQACLTVQQWQKDMEQMNKPRNSDCQISNRETDPQKFSFDISCTSQHGTTSGHWEMQFVDEEHSHGTAHLKNDQAGPNGQTIGIDMTIDAHFVSASCGDVQPGTPKILKQE